MWPFDVPDFMAGELGRPFFMTMSEAGGDSIRIAPAALGGDAPFGYDALIGVPAAAFEEDGSLEYRLYRLSESHSAPAARRPSRRPRAGQPAADPVEDELQLGPDDRLLLEGAADLATVLPVGLVPADCMCWDREASAGDLVLLDLGTDTLGQADYLIEVVQRTGGEPRVRRSQFTTHWRDMPLSLYDVEVAIRNLSFIEDRDLIREMLGGSREDRIAAFRSYWSERDPTPGTVENELMQEYYERIDYAASEFRTGRTPLPDGLRTDAARVYIIHGPPTDVSSTFPSSGGVQQIWSYSDGRRFTFWAASSLEPLVLEESKRDTGGL